MGLAGRAHPMRWESGAGGVRRCCGAALGGWCWSRRLLGWRRRRLVPV